MLETLRLQDFRCFKALGCEVAAPGITLFTGDNAQGKTTLLEAVCLLMRLQSPRARARGELVRFGEGRFGVAGEFSGRALKVVGAGDGLDLAVGGEPVARAADYLGASGLVVWMGNEDLELVRGPGEARRRYLDFLGAQLFSGYRASLRGYERALRSRNRLLKAPSPDRAEISAFTDVLVRCGDGLVAWRRELLGLLPPLAGAGHHEIGGGREALGLAYLPSADRGLDEAIAGAWEADRRRGTTTVGPHRDDFDVLVDGRPAARFASEGQQRTVALALKLAQARALDGRRSEPPLLLLDDIFGELDPGRRNLLLGALPAGSQKLITTTHLGWADGSFAPERAYHVESGTVREG